LEAEIGRLARGANPISALHRPATTWPFQRDHFHGLPMCRIPWSQGKMQGISPIQPFFANIRLESICEFSYLRDNSLSRRAGNFFASAGN
jgi:hypothetical protein